MRIPVLALHSSTALATALVVGSLEVTPAAAQESVVSACSGVSLPRSVVTDILDPIVTGIVTPVQDTVNPLLGVVDLLTLSLLPGSLDIDAAGLLDDAASGEDITLQVLATDGTVIGPSDECISTADAIALDTEKGVSIGGNRVTGLGADDREADAGEINSIAIGNDAATAADAFSSVAIGLGAEVGPGAIGAIALGPGAVATAPNSVALGANSTTTANLAAPAYNPGTGILAGALATGEVSVGGPTDRRRITNVAAGSADTDAVNVGQLKAVDARISEIDGWSIRYDSAAKDSATLEGASGTVIANLADGAVSSSSTQAVNGSQLHGVSQSVASHLGAGAVVNADGSITGPTYQIQGGDYTTVQGAFGAVDSEITTINTRIDTLDTTIGTLNDRAVSYDGGQGAPKDTITLQGGPGGTTITNLRPGLLDATSTDAVNGSQLHATNQALAELATGAVRYDLDADGNRTNAVTLLGGDPDAPVVVRNVATGVAGTDAVNVAQLDGGLSLTLNSAKAYADSLVFDAGGVTQTYVQQVAQTTLNQANSYTDMRVGELAMEVDATRREARQAAAVGLAAGSLRYDDTPGKFSVGMAGGFWRGEGAAAFGAGYTSETGRLRANVAATTAGGHVGGGAGVSLTLN